MSDTLIGLDPPQHNRLRRLVTPAFRPNVVRALRPRVEAISRELLDAAVPLRDFDFDAYARPLTERVIAELLGIQPGDRERYTRLSMVLERSVGHFLGQDLPEEQLAAEAAFAAYAGYIGGVLESRRENPGDDFISDLLRATAEPDGLTEHELLKMTILLNVAGATTTQTLLATTVLELSRRPEVVELLRGRRELVPNAVDEALRFHGTTHSVSRIGTRDTEIGGCPVHEGDTVLLNLQAADRDPAVFPDAGAFDITRPTGRHLAFAIGAHYCAGAALARTEAAVFLEQWLDRVQAFSCPPGPLDWAPGRLSNIILDSPPVHVEPVGTGGEV
ncbi:cytochrome P450 [Actinomadura physcomitrii]|uniref:cytochrome P450 n=1 Tax=Actinomadura physcomitrii TaxID=2650748 RepID=UPI001371D8AE|nr:cytochrome P450 [Actinomadura physcomitrii]